MTLRPVSQVHEDIIWDVFKGIVQTNRKAINSTDTFQIEGTRVNITVCSGGQRRPCLDFLGFTIKDE